MSRNVIITGANRGIGLALAKACKQQGDKVYALCRTSTPALDELGVVVISNVDITNNTSISRAVTALKNVKIDLLINNAGILRDESLNDFNQSTIVEQFNVNALAPLVLTHALLDNLSTGSKIAFITSRMGSITDNSSGGRYGYRMSKAALNIGAMSMAKDLESQQIAVGIYHPGYVQTDMVNHGGDISAEVSAQRLLGLMNNLSMDESGVFKHSNGEVLPW